MDDKTLLCRSTLLSPGYVFDVAEQRGGKYTPIERPLIPEAV